MRHQVGQSLIKSEQQDAPLASWSLAEVFKNNIFLDSLLLLFDGLQKVKVQYMVQEEKHNIFHFLSKNVEAYGDSFIMKLYAGLVYQLKLFVFERDGCFKEKRAVMFACNLISYNC